MKVEEFTQKNGNIKTDFKKENDHYKKFKKLKSQ